VFNSDDCEVEILFEQNNQGWVTIKSKHFDEEDIDKFLKDREEAERSSYKILSQLCLLRLKNFNDLLRIRNENLRLIDDVIKQSCEKFAW